MEDYKIYSNFQIKITILKTLKLLKLCILAETTGEKAVRSMIIIELVSLQ